MEFSLTINQKQIHENFPVLDIKDAAIIDFLTRFSHAKKIKKRIIGTDVYYWFDYGKIASENPLLKLDRESIRKRVRNICKLGILNAHPDNQGGEVYFAFGDNYEKTHRADLPEVEAQTSGKQSRTHRANNPELLAKHRANNPDNHNNHLSVNQDQGERTPPAPNPSNLQSQKKEMGLVAPPGFGNFDHFSGFGLDYLKTPETVKAETPPLPKVAPKGIPPVRLDAKEIRGLVDLTETYPFGFCETCQGQKVVGGRNGLIECPTCEGTGLGNGRTESENPPPAQFEVTAIASPTELPGVTLVEAAPIHHRRNGRIEIPDEAAAEILPWAKGDGEQTVKSWYDRAFRQHSPKDVEDMVMRFSTVFLSSEKAAFRDMMETNPLSFFKRRFAGFVADQKQYDRNNAPKEGGATRQTPPQNYTSQTRH